MSNDTEIVEVEVENQQDNQGDSNINYSEQEEPQYESDISSLTSERYEKPQKPTKKKRVLSEAQRATCLKNLEKARLAKAQKGGQGSKFMKKKEFEANSIQLRENESGSDSDTDYDDRRRKRNKTPPRGKGGRGNRSEFVDEETIKRLLRKKRYETDSDSSYDSRGSSRRSNPKDDRIASLEDKLDKLLKLSVSSKRNVRNTIVQIPQGTVESKSLQQNAKKRVDEAKKVLSFFD